MGRAKIWKSGYWSTALLQSNRGEDPERRYVVQHPTSHDPGRSISLGDFPRWSWLLVAILLLMLFVLLSASGGLLTPVLGHIARAADYLHEFAHDGRHLLAVPCH